MIAAIGRNRVRGWLVQLLSGGPHQVIGSDPDGSGPPYLRRWYLIPRNRFFNIYLHQFLRSDDDRALHDHPWWFVSLVLRGRYDEILPGRAMKRRRAGSIVFRRAEHRHAVQLLDGEGLYPPGPDGRLMVPPMQPCWTLIVTGPRVRVWGFWCTGRGLPDRFVPWHQWGDAGCGEP